MAVPELPEALQAAGLEYYGQLKSLGLRPEACLWMYRFTDEKFVLGVIWSGVDRFGPFQLSKLLFEAYRKTLLPRSIDPFLIELRSPREVYGAQILVSSGANWYRIGNKGADGKDNVQLQWSKDWIYYKQKKQRSVVEISRDWGRFNQSIAKAA